MPYLSLMHDSQSQAKHLLCSSSKPFPKNRRSLNFPWQAPEVLTKDGAT